MVCSNQYFQQPNKWPFENKKKGSWGAKLIPQQDNSEVVLVLSDPIIPFYQTKWAYVTVKDDPEGKVEIFLYEEIWDGIYDNDNWFTLASCVFKSIYTMVSPVNKNDPVLRPQFLWFKKPCPWKYWKNLISL